MYFCSLLVLFFSFVSSDFSITPACQTFNSYPFHQSIYSNDKTRQFKSVIIYPNVLLCDTFLKCFRLSGFLPLIIFLSVDLEYISFCSIVILRACEHEKEIVNAKLFTRHLQTN